MAFDQPYIPDVGNILAQQGRGYALGSEMRQQNAMASAGQALAQGNRKGAVNALYQAGEVESGLKIEDHFRQAARQANADNLAKAERFNRTLGNLAMLADTPEKWAAAIGSAKAAGLDVDKWADFGTRDYVLAQANKTVEMINLELERRRTEASAAKVDPYKVIPKGSRILDERNGQFLPQERAQADPELTLEQGKYEQALRKEYTSLTSDLRTINDSISRMKTAAQANSGAGDIAMVYSYMKMLDPTSVVREGEYATAENTGGLPEKVVNVYNKIISGQRLTPAQRQEFLAAGGALAEEKGKRFQKLRSQFEGIAKSSGADPSRIMLDEGMEQPAPDGGTNEVPSDAVQLLRSDPTPVRIRQFEEVFGTGSAQRALGR